MIKYRIFKRPTYEEIRSTLPKELLYELHVNQGLGISAIARTYQGVGVDTIKKLMSEYEISPLETSQLHKKFWDRQGVRQRMSEIRKGLWKDETYRNKTLVHIRDRDSIARRSIKFSAKYQGVAESEWRGFLTTENQRAREGAEYREWRHQVFLRDNYTCQCCGDHCHEGHIVVLNAHHLDSFASNINRRLDVSNGVTLCNKCHDPRQPGSFHNIYGTVNNTKAQYEEYIRKLARLYRV